MKSLTRVHFLDEMAGAPPPHRTGHDVGWGHTFWFLIPHKWESIKHYYILTWKTQMDPLPSRIALLSSWFRFLKIGKNSRPFVRILADCFVLLQSYIKKHFCGGYTHSRLFYSTQAFPNLYSKKLESWFRCSLQLPYLGAATVVPRFSAFHVLKAGLYFIKMKLYTRIFTSSKKVGDCLRTTLKQNWRKLLFVHSWFFIHS